MNTADPIRVSIDARAVATVTMARPEVHNAFDNTMIAMLTTALEEVGRHDGVRVVVLAGEGKSFSAGADLGWMKAMAGYTHEENRRDAEALARLMGTLNDLPKPTIARVHGAALGGGVGLVACCDIAIAAARAKFGLTEVRLGLIPAVISPYVVGAIGARASRRLFLTGERFDAAVAGRLGLVHQVVEDEDALDAAVDAAVADLLAGGPGAIAAAKDLIAAVADRPVDEALVADTARRIADIRATPEGQEGLSAFLEKRLPGWM